MAGSEVFIDACYSCQLNYLEYFTTLELGDNLAGKKSCQCFICFLNCHIRFIKNEGVFFCSFDIFCSFKALAMLKALGMFSLFRIAHTEAKKCVVPPLPLELSDQQWNDDRR